MQSDVLVVCTGNVCRSPYVAARLQQELPALDVSSAGTGALVGRPPSGPTQALLLDRGLDVAAQVGRSIDKGMVRGARLVLTAERRHRVEVVRLVPDADDRTYTLVELARILLLEGSPSGLGVDGVVDLARKVVGRGEEVDYDDDLADPYGRSDEHYRRMAAHVEEALSILVPALRAGSGTP